VLAVEQWAEIRRLYFVEKRSKRAIHRLTGVHRDTITRAIEAETPPRYVRAPRGSKLDASHPSTSLPTTTDAKWGHFKRPRWGYCKRPLRAVHRLDHPEHRLVVDANASREPYRRRRGPPAPEVAEQLTLTGDHADVHALATQIQANM